MTTNLLAAGRSRIRAESPVYGGYVLGREGLDPAIGGLNPSGRGGVVFIKRAVPGEVVEVEVKEKKKDYSVAVVVNVVEPSEFRVEPPCRYFGDCGGCSLQHISYERQVSIKEEVLLDCLKRIGGLDISLMPPVFGDAFHYRRRAQFKLSKDGAIGFYREGTRDVIAISSCPLMKDPINEALSKFGSLNLTGIKEIHVTCGDSLIALVKGRGFDEAMASSFMEAGFSGVSFDDHSYTGKGHVSLSIELPEKEPLIYTISPWAFFQSNWELNLKAAGLIAEGLSPLEGKTVIYLYAGAGNFALPLAKDAKEVIAIEENPDSVKDGSRNIALNGIKNFKFIGQRAEKALPKGDVVLVDPPRPGLADRVVKSIIEMSPEKIVYVSCNPSTLARDLKKLSERYDIESVRSMDFFPNTYHVEAMAFLRRKG